MNIFLKLLNFRVLTLCLLLEASFALSQTSTLHSWTASDGRVIEAKFVRLEGESVVIEKDGKTFAVPFSRLAPASVEQAKKLAAPPLSQNSEPAKFAMLWSLNVVPLRDPAKPEEHVSYRMHEVSGGRLFCSGIAGASGIAVALVDGTSGKVLWQSMVPFTPEEIAEADNYLGSVKETPSGFLLSSTSGKVNSSANPPNKGRFYVRLIDPISGNQKAIIGRSWSDPEKNEDGDRPPGLQYPGELIQCGSKMALMGVGYVAELADDLSSVTRHCKIPAEQFLDYAGVEGGVLHNSGVIGDPNKTTHFAPFGGIKTDLTPPPSDWKAKVKSPNWQSIGNVALIDLEVEGGTRALGAYDIAAKSWKWKSDANAKKWGLTGVSGKWLKSWPDLPDKRRVIRICDGDTGAFTLEQDGSFAALHANGHVVIAKDVVERGQGVMGTTQDISRFDCANGRKLWTVPSRKRGYYYATEILPDGRVLLADVEADTLKLELIDESNGQPASVHLELTPPPRGRLSSEPTVPPSPYSPRDRNIQMHFHNGVCVIRLGSYMDQVVLGVSISPQSQK
ncbi:MAG: hypothetical protein JNJ83_00410 [Verrucomicrobiaceae bacterium]|nr:hypothetical protein [Verrucomicrobiaceae bacterium]